LVITFSYKKMKRILFLVISSFVSWLIITAVSVYLTTASQTLFLIDNSISITMPVSFQTEMTLEAINYIEKDVPDKGIIFKYPSGFKFIEETFEGGEIIYHLNFVGKSDDVNGYIQIWNLKATLDEFIKHARSTSSTNIYDFKQDKITVRDLSGYIWNYKIKSTQGNIVARQAFLEKDFKMYVVSLFVPQGANNGEYDDIFKEMVNSLQIKPVT